MKNENELEEEKALDTMTNNGAEISDATVSANGHENEALLSSVIDAPGAGENFPEHAEPEHHFEDKTEEAEVSELSGLSEATSAPAVSYEHFSKSDFVKLIQSVATEGDLRKADATLREIKPLFDEIRHHERTEALHRFQQNGGIEEDFEFKGDQDDNAFDTAFRLIRDKRTAHYKNVEESKVTNLKHKEEILTRLRALSENEDSEHSLQSFKQLQNEWRSIGPVAPAQSKTLWANYAALVDRFYDQRSIYFELKELDRRKNLEQKLELCEKAEKLAGAERIQQAVRELNELHNEFKHIGPVPKDEKDKVWLRFKSASDALYAKRDQFIAQLSVELQKNLESKNVLGEELASFASFQSDRIKEWNQKTQDILALQKKWEAVGAIPRAKSKDINKKFWAAFKGFFNNKNSFFKKLDEGRDKNLAAKQAIIAKANELKDNKDWDKTANALKDLQVQWKEIGPVQEKFREKIFQEFKAACDHFFEQRRGLHDAADKEQEGILKQKEEVCAELEKLAAEKSGTMEQLNELQARFNELGFVPKKAVAGIRTRFNDAVTKLLGTLDISTNDKEKALLGIQLNSLKNDPHAEEKIYQKEQALRKRISKMENDIAVLRNNLEFFGRSRNAEKMKEEFNAQIATAMAEITQAKNQLKMLKTAAS